MDGDGSVGRDRARQRAISHRAIKEASFEHMDGLDGEEIDDPDPHEATANNTDDARAGERECQENHQVR